MPRPDYIPVPVGTKSHRLTVVNENGGRIRQGTRGQEWCVWAECECGDRCVKVVAKELRAGKVKSCGCLLREKRAAFGGNTERLKAENRKCPNAREPNVLDELGRIVRLERCFVCVPNGGRGNLGDFIAKCICKWCGWRSK